MGVFEERKDKFEKIKEKENSDKDIVIIERPRICCIDVNGEIISALLKNGANIYNGTLGSKIKIPNSNYRDNRQLLLNFSFPENLHEFDIIIIDLGNVKTIDYIHSEHTLNTFTGNAYVSVLSSYPETLFDPRPLASSILKNRINEINKEFLVLVFAAKSYDVEYQFLEIGKTYSRDLPGEEHNIYSFWDNIRISGSKFGTEVKTIDSQNQLKTLLEKYQSKCTYDQTFYHPTIQTKDGSTESKKFLPLMVNKDDEIVAYIEADEERNIIIIPQIEDKRDFILNFLSNAAPSIYPSFFPYAIKFDWKTQELYWLPNHSILLGEKSQIENRFKKEIGKSEKKIKENSENFSFLHEILSATGDALTHSLIKYFQWMGFSDVKHFDFTKNDFEILEEDIQIKLPDGLLIIECKGIGGTSTDAECYQISKIKHRRCRERNKFDVFALYVVNHQRYLPPLKRNNPPFSSNQIQDAKNDERGLVSTWQLFNLYFEIENKIITKEAARASLLNVGLVEFRPSGLTFIYQVTEIYKEGYVCIITIENIFIKVNDCIFIEKNGRFEKAVILDIQENGNSVKEIYSGEIGLKLSVKISKKSILWKQT